MLCYVTSCYSLHILIPLNVELGRFVNKKREERICDICKSNVEDEQHFIFTCPAYKPVRDQFSSFVEQKYDINNLANVDLLNIYMSDKSVAYKFGSFLKDCFEIKTICYLNSVS